MTSCRQAEDRYSSLCQKMQQSYSESEMPREDCGTSLLGSTEDVTVKWQDVHARQRIFFQKPKENGTNAQMLECIDQLWHRQ